MRRTVSCVALLYRHRLKHTRRIPTDRIQANIACVIKRIHHYQVRVTRKIQFRRLRWRSVHSRQQPPPTALHTSVEPVPRHTLAERRALEPARRAEVVARCARGRGGRVAERVHGAVLAERVVARRLERPSGARKALREHLVGRQRVVWLVPLLAEATELPRKPVRVRVQWASRTARRRRKSGVRVLCARRARAIAWSRLELAQRTRLARAVHPRVAGHALAHVVDLHLVRRAEDALGRPRRRRRPARARHTRRQSAGVRVGVVEARVAVALRVVVADHARIVRTLRARLRGHRQRNRVARVAVRARVRAHRALVCIADRRLELALRTRATHSSVERIPRHTYAVGAVVAYRDRIARARRALCRARNRNAVRCARRARLVAKRTLERPSSTLHAHTVLARVPGRAKAHCLACEIVGPLVRTASFANRRPAARRKRVHRTRLARREVLRVVKRAGLAGRAAHAVGETLAWHAK